MTIPIKGIISSDDNFEVYQWLGYTAVSPNTVADMLGQLNDGEPAKIEINSYGGDVFAGSEIFTALKSYAGTVEVNIVGLAASAASIIAMAGDTVKISPTAQLMIHRASTASAGNSDDLASDLQGLDATDQAIVNVYADKTGLDKQTIYKMMSDATWINAETAIKRGFADEIMFTDQATTITNNTGQMLLNKDAIAKVKTLIHKNKQQNNVEKNKKIEDELSQLKEKKLAILLSK